MSQQTLFETQGPDMMAYNDHGELVNVGPYTAVDRLIITGREFYRSRLDSERNKYGDYDKVDRYFLREALTSELLRIDPDRSLESIDNTADKVIREEDPQGVDREGYFVRETFGKPVKDDAEYEKAPRPTTSLGKVGSGELRPRPPRTR